MKTIILFIMLGLITCIVYKKHKDSCIAIFIGNILILMIITLPLFRYSYKCDAVRYNAFKQTINTSRINNMNDIEKSATLNKIAEWNEYVASTKYKKNTVLDLYIPKEMLELEEIK